MKKIPAILLGILVVALPLIGNVWSVFPVQLRVEQGMLRRIISLLTKIMNNLRD